MRASQVVSIEARTRYKISEASEIPSVKLSDYRKYFWELTGTEQSIASFDKDGIKQFGLLVTRKVDTIYAQETYEKLKKFMGKVCKYVEVIIGDGVFEKKTRIHVFIPSTLSWAVVSKVVYGLGKFNANPDLSIIDLMNLLNTETAKQFIRVTCDDISDSQLHYPVRIRPITSVNYHSDISGHLMQYTQSGERLGVNNAELIGVPKWYYSQDMMELCDCDIYLCSTDNSGRTENGLMLVHRDLYKHPNSSLRDHRWYVNHNYMFDAITLISALVWQSELSCRKPSATIFVGKGTGLNQEHEVGVFIPCSVLSDAEDALESIHHIKNLFKCRVIDEDFDSEAMFRMTEADFLDSDFELFKKQALELMSQDKA